MGKSKVEVLFVFGLITFIFPYGVMFYILYSSCRKSTISTLTFGTSLKYEVICVFKFLPIKLTDKCSSVIYLLYIINLTIQ